MILDLLQRTALTPTEEDEFLRWYQSMAATQGLDLNPDDPRHLYDWRGAWKAGNRTPSSGGHWPSRFKAETHPNRYVDGLDTKTGKRRGTPNR
jgi:hypothetical protein